MTKRFIILFFFLLLLTLFISFYNIHNKNKNISIIENGQADLTNWNSSINSQNIKLNGDWEFYWKKLYSPEELASTSFERQYAYAPIEWSRIENQEQKLNEKGYATYRTVIHLNKDTLYQQLALRIPASCSAYSVWINSRLVSSSGIVGTSKETEKPWTVSDIVYFTPTTKTLELVIHISNFHQRKNGMWDSFIIGHKKNINKEDSVNFIVQLLMMGSALIMSVFYFFTYFFKRTNIMALYFSIICLFFGIRLGVIDGYILRELISSDYFTLVNKLEYISISLCTIFIIKYVSEIFPHEKNDTITKFLTYTSIMYSFFILVTPVDIFTLTLYFQIANTITIFSYHVFYVYPLAVIRKKQWAISNLIASFIIITTAINDSFYYIGHISSTIMAYAGFFVFYLVQIMTMANKMSNAYKHLEVMSIELQNLNSSLEKKVEERTKELETLNNQLALSNEKLQKIEITRREFLSNISHDLGTPMQSVLGIMEMLQKEIIKDNFSKYYNIVIDRLLFIKKMTDDLFELTKIEENQTIYEFSEHDAWKLLSNIYDKFNIEFEKKNIEFQLHYINNILPNEKIIIKIDEFRIEQLFQNLLQNALKFTNTNGLVVILPEINREQNHLVIKIADTGIGIEEDILPHIFKRFVKEDISRNKIEGIGLGLAIVNEIIRAHNGEIFVESKKNIGTVFTILLKIEKIDSI